MCNTFLPRKTQFIAYGFGLRVYAIILVCPNVFAKTLFFTRWSVQDITMKQEIAFLQDCWAVFFSERKPNILILLLSTETKPLIIADF